jgi:hypothetical protein
MGTTQKVVGTSLEVLAPYLPYGIEIKHLLFEGRSIILQPGDLHHDAIYFEDMWEWQLSECLPVLRPFSALATPLEDGTAPAAIEFARSFVTDQHGMLWSEARIDKVYENGDLMLHIPDRHPTRYDHYYVLHADWSGLPLEAYGWLVKNHFAVGLEPHQFIEATPSTPTREADNTATTIL